MMKMNKQKKKRFENIVASIIAYTLYGLYLGFWFCLIMFSLIGLILIAG